MPAEPVLVISDRVLARLATNVAARTPGVGRLHASPLIAARHVLRRTGRLARLPGAEIPQVDVERGGDDCTVTVRLSVRIDRPVIEIVGAVQQRVADALRVLAGLDATVVVQVLDLDS